MEKLSTETEKSTIDAVETVMDCTLTTSNESQENTRSRLSTLNVAKPTPSRKLSFGSYFNHTSIPSRSNRRTTTLTWNWRNHKSVILGSSSKIEKASSKIAMFDMDGTLIVNRTGLRVTDWEFFCPSVPQKLRELHDDGFRIVLASN